MNLHIRCFTKKNVKNNKSHYYYLIKLITCIPEQKKFLAFRKFLTNF